ncbi:MAG: hypothetical protein V7676_02275 [Parasphingorhabdus sp.]|uniref:hypothetical protein n=1 Tax=Parasphingorhabdus sp. TaxID=2709688 RepID=UPI003002628B
MAARRRFNGSFSSYGAVPMAYIPNIFYYMTDIAPQIVTSGCKFRKTLVALRQFCHQKTRFYWSHSSQRQ